MEMSMKYRTQGSLPIGTQRRAQYIPRIPEEPTRAKPEAAFLQGQTNEDQKEQQALPKTQAPPAPSPRPPPTMSHSLPSTISPRPPPTMSPGPPRFIKPSHDPCKAIIETSPYYIYFKIVTTKDTKETPDEDLKSILNELIVVDKDLPRTAKYRHFRSYEQ